MEIMHTADGAKSTAPAASSLFNSTLITLFSICTSIPCALSKAKILPLGLAVSAQKLGCQSSGKAPSLLSLTSSIVDTALRDAVRICGPSAMWK